MAIQDKFNRPNVIYKITKDIDLGGGTLTIPEGCTLDFQGGSFSNGTIVFDNTRLQGSVKFENVAYTGKISENTTLNVKGLGAKGDGTTDDTDIIKNIIKLAYSSSFNDSGWRMCRKIYFPSGEYLITDSLIDDSLGISAGRFLFCGESSFNTRIKFTGDYLFKNTQIFGFTEFREIEFSGNQINNFMYLQGGGLGNAQSLEFYRCLFTSWHTILEIIGGSMTSETTFAFCKIRYCGDENNPCRLFDFNNPQSVNFRLFATDIEIYVGTCYYCAKGTAITHYQGSNIPLETAHKSIVIEIPSDADVNSFGETNSPLYTAYGVRYELRGTSYLVNKKAYANAVINHENCGLGGYNLSSDNDFYAIDIVGQGVLNFKQCHNFSGYKVRHGFDGSSYVPCVINTDNALFLYLKNSSVTYVAKGSTSNFKSALNLINIITGERYTVGTKGEFVNVGNTSPSGNLTSELKNRILDSVSSSPNELIIISANNTTRDVYVDYKGMVSNISLYNFAKSGYGYATYNLNVYNSQDGEKGDLIASFNDITINSTVKQNVDLDTLTIVSGLVFEYTLSQSFGVAAIINGTIVMTCT